jgi:hypothetical protein
LTRRDALIQFGAALLVFALLSIFIRVPGYMDAEYYTLSAEQIAAGKGLTQPILWNYLDDPTGLPHPSHTYWMPAPSLIAAAGMFLSGKPDFATARIPFLLFAALAAPAAGWMGFRFSRRRSVAWLAAGLAICCGYYSPYTATADSFFLIMAGAWVFFFASDRIEQSKEKNNFMQWLIIGLACGWVHLNRADGLLWLVLAIGLWLVYGIFPHKGMPTSSSWISLFMIFAGYFAITGFWYFRNLTQFASLFPPNSSRAFWMTSYNELFAYPPEQLRLDHWLASGLANILNDRFVALGRNLMVIAAVQGMILFVPFWIIAFWKRRKDSLLRLVLGMEVVILLIMSFVFPYSGMRGGFLHSSAALQPVLWGLAAAGAADVIQWVGDRRKWNIQRSEKMFLPGIMFVCGLITVLVFQMVVIGSNPQLPAWEDSSRSAEYAKDILVANNLPSSTRVLINNPAGFALTTGGEALVIPDGPEESTLEVAGKYETEYLILERNHVSGLDSLYTNPQENPKFSLLGKKDDVLLFRIRPAGG